MAHRLNLFQVLSHDERVIVLSHEGHQQVYTWNHSLTLQCWDVKQDGSLVEVESHTLETIPRSLEAAQVAAREWLHSNSTSQAW